MVDAEEPLISQGDLARSTIWYHDAAGCSMSGIVTQYDGFRVSWLINVNSRKCSPAEQHDKTYHSESITIKETNTATTLCSVYQSQGLLFVWQ